MTKDEYYLRIADAVSAKSSCLKKNYGAVIVKDDIVVSTGYNGPCRGEAHCIACTKVKLDKDMSEYETCPAVHAEMNAIISAARKDMIGATLYLSGRRAPDYKFPEGQRELGLEIEAWPCEICLRLIKNSGINRIINKSGCIYQRADDGILYQIKEHNTVK